MDNSAGHSNRIVKIPGKFRGFVTLIVTIRQGVGGQVRSGWTKATKRTKQTKRTSRAKWTKRTCRTKRPKRTCRACRAWAWRVWSARATPLLPAAAVKDSAEQSGAKVETATAEHENHKA